AEASHSLVAGIAVSTSQQRLDLLQVIVHAGELFADALRPRSIQPAHIATERRSAHRNADLAKTLTDLFDRLPVVAQRRYKLPRLRRQSSDRAEPRHHCAPAWRSRWRRRAR